jgi:hypothetical protein
VVDKRGCGRLWGIGEDGDLVVCIMSEEMSPRQLKGQGSHMKAIIGQHSVCGIFPRLALTPGTGEKSLPSPVPSYTD